MSEGIPGTNMFFKTKEEYKSELKDVFGDVKRIPITDLVVECIKLYGNDGNIDEEYLDGIFKILLHEHANLTIMLMRTGMDDINMAYDIDTEDVYMWLNNQAPPQ